METTVAKTLARSRQPSAPPVPSRPLPDVFSAYLTDGPGWTDADRAFSREAKAAALDIAAKMAARARGHVFALLGQTTVGKTMLMRLLLKFWRAMPPLTYRSGEVPQFHTPRFISWPSHDWRIVEDERLTPFVVLDEIGRGGRSASGADRDRLIEFLSVRESRGLWTGVTANLTFDELREMDAALAERLRRNGSIAIQALSDVQPFTARRI